MTPYSTAHIAIALLCAFICVVHVVVWRFVAADRDQFWISVVFGGFALLNAGIAGSGQASGAALGDTRIWVLVTFAGAIVLWWSPLFLLDALFGQPTPKRRRVVASLIVALGAVRFGEVVWVAFQSNHDLTYEAVHQGTGSGLAMTCKVVVLGVSFALLREGIAAARRRNPLGWVVLVCAVPSAFLLGREFAIASGWLQGPTAIGFLGLPFMAAMSSVIGMRYVLGRRRAEEEVGGYRIVRPLGRGGMGELYLARRTGPGGFQRHVAIKKLHPTRALDPVAEKRLLHEARLSARLSHRHVISVFDVGLLPGGHGFFVAMEYLPGVDLAEIRNRARLAKLELPIELVLEVVEAAASGLAHAHGVGIVHRDVSPANIMVTFDGQVKLVDFGVAREMDAHATPTDMAGKVPYIAPEVVTGRGNTPAADIWSLGVVLYELAALTRPFEGAVMEEIATAARSGFVRLSKRRANLPAGLDALVDATLCPAPEGRFGSAADLAEALGRMRATLPRSDLGAYVRRLCARELAAERRLALLEGVDDRSRAVIESELETLTHS